MSLFVLYGCVCVGVCVCVGGGRVCVGGVGVGVCLCVDWCVGGRWVCWGMCVLCGSVFCFVLFCLFGQKCYTIKFLNFI